MKKRTWLSSILLGAVVLTAFAGVCVKTGFVSVAEYGMPVEHPMMMTDCSTPSYACTSTMITGHMRLLSQALPIILQNIFASILLALGLLSTFYFLLSLLARPPRAPLTERLRQRLRHLVQPFHTPALIFAFSNGILHPKRVA